jgi:uncharacterized damage-inducible protein DinB
MRNSSRLFFPLWMAFLIVAASCSGIAQENDHDKNKIQNQEKHKAEGKQPAADEDSQISVGTVLSASVLHLQRVFLPLAQAMPEDKFDYAPSSGEFKGVRTFAQQLKHVAATNYIYGAAITGEKPPVDVGDEEGPPSMKSRAEILKFVTNSFYYVQKAFEKIDATNVVSPINNPFGEGKTTRLSMAALIIGHCNDHYGQMAEYLRLNGIVPPASQH